MSERSNSIPFAQSDHFYAAKQAAAENPEFSRLLGGVVSDEPALLARARNRRADSTRRWQLLQALRPQWEKLKLGKAAQLAGERLEDPNTHIIIAGQQPALLGGPLMLHSKILSAVALCEWLISRGEAAIPIFWLADEDHDVGELYSGIYPSLQESYAEEIPFDRGRVSFSRLQSSRLQELPKELCQRFPGIGQWQQGLLASADSSPSFSFLQLLCDWYSEEALLFVSPQWLRPLAAPEIAAEFKDAGRLQQEVLPRIEELAAVGLAAPIPKVEALPLFWVDDSGARHRLDPIVGEPGGWQARGGASLHEDQIHTWLKEEPQRFSPDALLRPLIQDRLLEPLATIVGPTELGYHLQLGEAYSKRGISRPLLMHRLRARVVEPKTVAKLELLGVSPKSLHAKSTAASLVPSELGAQFQQRLLALGEDLLGLVAELNDEERFGRPLAKRSDRWGRRLQSDFEKLSEAIGREVDEDVRTNRAELEAILSELWPGGRPAERAVSVVDYLHRFGMELFEKLKAAYNPFDAREQLLILPGKSADFQSSEEARS